MIQIGASKRPMMCTIAAVVCVITLVLWWNLLRESSLHGHSLRNINSVADQWRIGSIIQWPGHSSTVSKTGQWHSASTYYQHSLIPSLLCGKGGWVRGYYQHSSEGGPGGLWWKWTLCQLHHINWLIFGLYNTRQHHTCVQMYILSTNCLHTSAT